MAARTSFALPAPRRDLPWLAAACACAAACLVVLIFLPQGALRGWLAGFFLLGGVPIGALVLSAMMRLIPGLWSNELQPFSDAIAELMPFAALAFLPVLVGAAWLYPWAASVGKGAFREAWMTLPFWSLRAVAFLFLVSAFSRLLLGGRAHGATLPAAGLMLLIALFLPVAVDWFLFLDAEAHFSGFMLLVLSNFFLGALCAAILLALASGSRIERPDILGGLLVTALLAWAYFSFTQYFITWSDNLAFGVRWYADRGSGGWALAEYGLVALRLLPLGLLLFPPVRRGRRWLAALCLAVLAGNALEALWLIVPAGGGIAEGDAPAVLVGLLAMASLILFGGAVLRFRAPSGGTAR